MEKNKFWFRGTAANPGSLKERIRKRVRGSGFRSLPTGGLVTSVASWYSGRGHPNLCFPFLLPFLGIIKHHCIHWCLSKFLLSEKKDILLDILIKTAFL